MRTVRTRSRVAVAATVTGASGRPSLSITASTPSASQQSTTGGANRRDPGTVRKPPSPRGQRTPGVIAAMLVRTDTGVSTTPVNLVNPATSRTREVSAR